VDGGKVLLEGAFEGWELEDRPFVPLWIRFSVSLSHYYMIVSASRGVPKLGDRIQELPLRSRLAPSFRLEGASPWDGLSRRARGSRRPLPQVDG
jgi:hypothetical protein